jgi:AAA domain
MSEQRERVRQAPTLADLADSKRWVVWCEEEKTRTDGSTYLTKIPYDPNSNGQARVPTEPSTWGTREQAEQRWDELRRSDDDNGGVGIVLGELAGGNLLMGIDLDRCFKQNGNIFSWAVEVLDRFKTYAEVSPSGEGIKLFFLIAASDIEPVKQLLGKTRKSFAAGKHREIAIDRARYYAVTDDRFNHSPTTLRTVSRADIRWLIEEAGPNFLDRHNKSKPSVAGAQGRDQSGSGFGFRFMCDRGAAGDSYAEARAALRADTGAAGEWARRVDERQLERAWDNAGEKAPPNKANPAKTVVAINAEALRTTEFAPIKYAVPQYIVEGVTILAGKPKVGKSWLLLGAAIAVASGTKTLDEICKQGDALYCALEDNRRRLKGRMKKLLGGLDQPWPKRLEFWTQMPRLGDGGLDKLKEWIKQAKRPRLIILDTLARVRTPSRKEQSTYEADYNAISDLRDFAGEYGVAVVLAHHLRKGEADDPFDTISGTLGLTGAADSMLVLKRSQGQVTLYGRGRDLLDVEKAVEFDKQRCTWTVKGDAAGVRVSEQRQAIIDALRRVGGASTPKVIEYETGMTGGNVRYLLHMLLRDGDIERVQRGRYRVR